MLIWNCRGANNPNFCNNVSDMSRRHYPTIVIINETKLSGDRVKGIIDRLPLDGAIVAKSFGWSGVLWLLWDFDQVELAELSSTEQEILTIVSSTTNSPWLLFAVYASPRLAKRRLLWDNLETVAAPFIALDHCK